MNHGEHWEHGEFNDSFINKIYCQCGIKSICVHALPDGNAGDHFAGGRIADLSRRAAGGAHTFAVDEHLSQEDSLERY